LRRKFRCVKLHINSPVSINARFQREKFARRGDTAALAFWLVEQRKQSGYAALMIGL
jgi:hypothetical protein